MSETFRVGDEPTSDLFAAPTEEEKGDGMVSALEGLRAALGAPVDAPPITLRVPARPGVTIRCHTRMSQEQRKAWQARAKLKKRRAGNDGSEVDEMLFAQLVIANTCEAIAFNGTDAHDEEGTPLTFAHRQLWDMVGASDAPTAIRQLFGVDAHVLIASGEVLLASGFDDELNDGEGPTRAS